MRDTIVAVATSMATAAGVNIVRISGERAYEIATEIFVSRKVEGAMSPNYMYLGRIEGDHFSEKAFCVYYKSPFSYTGEDVVEIHCHGGVGVTRAIVRLVREKGARPAEAGEFTRRAFLNGKLTLSEADGVADMIAASTESQIKNAYRLMNGELTQGIDEAERILTKTAAMLEAKLDYPEELEEETRPAAKENLLAARGKIAETVKRCAHRKTVNEGIDVAIVGIPNAGKSSLLNALVGQDRAIVSDEAGTTRDVVKESVELDGIRFNFLDTAGIRGEGAGKVEKIGIERSKRAIESADVTINVIDLSVPESEDERSINALLLGKTVVTVLNKMDKAAYPRGEGIDVRADTGEGVRDVTERLLSLSGRDEIFSEGVITNERHVYAMEEALRQTDEALTQYDALPSECVLENVRAALLALGKITGNNVSESVIDEVFSRFCVGK